MPRPRHRGFYIIFGYRTLSSPAGRRMAQVTCPACRQIAWLQARREQAWFTLFFLPIFPIGIPNHFTICCACNSRFSTPFEDLVRQARLQTPQQAPTPFPPAPSPFAVPLTSAPAPLASAPTPKPAAPTLAPSHGLLEQLQQHPDNPALLAPLLTFYLDHNLPNDALRASRLYSTACEKSDACTLLAAKACLLLGDPDAALLRTNAALALNPHNPEALSLRTSLLNPTRPSTASALSRWAAEHDAPN